MRPRRINFGLGLRWTHGGRMALDLAVVLLFGLAAPSTASALQFDSFSLSAFVESTAITGVRPVATFTATAPDFSLQWRRLREIRDRPTTDRPSAV